MVLLIFMWESQFLIHSQGDKVAGAGFEPARPKGGGL